jgi:hypothetical protein
MDHLFGRIQYETEPYRNESRYNSVPSIQHVLKRQCHEMVVEMDQCKDRSKLWFANPFFCLKVGRFKATPPGVWQP